jgi:hypothetical protein
MAVLPLCALFGLICPRTVTLQDDKSVVGVWRRLFAVYIDFSVLFALMTPFIIGTVLCFEWIATNEFRWSFSRDFFRRTDFLLWAFILVVMWGCFQYFYQHAKLQKATLGQFIMGYKIVSCAEKGKPQYLRRVFEGAIAWVFWPIMLFKYAKNKDGIFWWDESTNTRAVRTIEQE